MCALAERVRLYRWVKLFAASEGLEYNESELLPDFQTNVFIEILGYTAPASGTRLPVVRRNLKEAITLGEWGAGILLGIGRLLTSPLRTLWRRLWVGPRAELDLTWEGPPIIIPSQPIRMSRAVGVTVTAAKYEDFVLAKGVVEVRPVKRWKWAVLTDVGKFIRLPTTVSANRQHDFRMSGKSILEQLPAEIRREPFEIRVSLRDHHRTRVVSAPLHVDEDELSREDH